MRKLSPVRPADSSLNGVAFYVLNQLMEGTVSPEKKDFSLLAVSQVEPIENELINDKQAFQNKPEAVDASDKFLNSTDAFYELDDDVPEEYIKRNLAVSAASKPDITSFVAEVATKMLNLSPAPSASTNGSSRSASATSAATSMATTNY
jgi:hypothetical protein